MRYCILIFIIFPSIIFGQKMDKLLIDSKHLERKIDVFVMDYNEGNESPIYYFTDGKKMIDNGTVFIIDSLSKNELIPKAKYVFVSTIDPKTNEDFRNEYFFCNNNYVNFFEKELLPKVESKTKINQQRYLIGVSFGGLNAAFFAAKTNVFDGFTMLSPITYPCEDLSKELVFSKYEDYKIYISTGKADAEYYVKTLYPILKSKTKKIKLVNTEGGHDFENWNNQILNFITFMNK